jgi:electron transfer flavoprotein alpha/beta subunit
VTRAIALIHRSSELPLVRLGVSLGETIAIAVAPPGEAIESVLVEARKAGAARTVRLWDDAVDSTDYLGVAYTLAAAVRTVLGGDLTANPAVILCGDEGRAAVGPAVAERLAVPHLGDVLGASMMDARVVARRRSGSLIRLYAARPPVVLCVSVADATTANAGAPPAGAAGSTEEWTLTQAGLTGAELAYRKRFRPQPSPGPTPSARVFSDVAELIERLRADGVLGRKKVESS